jgi:hypothetical protein
MGISFVRDFWIFLKVVVNDVASVEPLNQHTLWQKMVLLSQFLIPIWADSKIFVRHNSCLWITSPPEGMPLSEGAVLHGVAIIFTAANSTKDHIHGILL